MTHQTIILKYSF